MLFEWHVALENLINSSSQIGGFAGWLASGRPIGCPKPVDQPCFFLPEGQSGNRRIRPVLLDKAVRQDTPNLLKGNCKVAGVPSKARQAGKVVRDRCVSQAVSSVADLLLPAIVTGRMVGS
jgi:hypothetical protein